MSMKQVANLKANYIPITRWCCIQKVEYNSGTSPEERIDEDNLSEEEGCCESLKGI